MALEPNAQLQLADESRRGQEALNVINSAVYSDAMKVLKQDIIDKWEQCPARDIEGREWLWKLYQNAIKFEAVLQNIMETGKMADITLKQEGFTVNAVRAVRNIWR